MTIYNILELFFLFLLVLEIKGKHTVLKRLSFFYFESFLTLFILAFRNYNVGADSILYTSYYTNPNTYYGRMPIGFELFCDGLKLISHDWHFFIFITSLVSILPFLYYVKKYASIVTLPFLTFMLCWNLLWLLETPIKQTTAITFFFYGYILFIEKSEKRKWLKKIVATSLIIFSILTHSSMVLVALVLFILHYTRFTVKISLICILGSVLLSSFMIYYIPELYKILSSYAMAFDLFSNVENYRLDVESGLITYDIKKYLIPSIYTMIIISMCTDNEMKSLPAKCLVVGNVIFNLFISFPNIPRVVLFYTLIGSSLCPQILLTIRKKSTKRKFILIIAISIAFIYIHLKLCSNFKPTMEADFLPYTFWFE